MTYRPSYQSRPAGLASRSRDWDQDGDGDRFRERRREFDNWYANIYPNWLGYGYPYTIDPGFFDWGGTEYAPDYSEYDQSTAPAAYPLPYDESPGYPNPDADEGEGARSQQYAAAESTLPSTPGQLLTLIFKDGRPAVKVQNYMLTAKVFTDLDAQHYEKIPLDQIDLAATQRANSASGVDFQVPGAMRD